MLLDVEVMKSYIIKLTSCSFFFPLMLQGDFCEFLKRKGALKPIAAVRLALDIARSVIIYYYFFPINPM